MNVIFGIDPGLKGGVSVIIGNEMKFAFPIPVKNDEIDFTRLFVEISKIRDYVRQNYKQPVRYYGFIEKVGAMPGQGVVSMFTFGSGYGGVKSVLRLHMPLESVTPQSWKKEVLQNYDWKQKVDKLVIPKDASKEKIKELKKEHNKLKTEAKKRAKDISIQYVNDNFPHIDLRYGCKIQKDGLADACCIAVYGAIQIDSSLKKYFLKKY